MAVEASCVDSLHTSNVVKISRESKKGSPDRYLELLLSCADSREVRQLVRFKIQFCDYSVHLVESIEEPSIGEIEVSAETVNHNDYPVSVATVTFLDRWCRVARDSAFRQCYEAICEA